MKIASKIVQLILTINVLQNIQCYLDISLEVSRTTNQIKYTVPIKINDITYSVVVQLQNTKNYIMSVSTKMKELKKNKKHKQKHTKDGDKSDKVEGLILASSLQGYSFQGWKRFFMEAFLYIESRYYHQIKIDLTQLQLQEDNDKNAQSDGIISFGPNLKNNLIYSLIKTNNQFIQKDIVSIYRGINDKNVRMQLGGFEESFARGHRNGVLFYEMDIFDNNGKWSIPVQTVSCMRERNGKQQIFYITNSQLNLSISLTSPILKLPLTYSTELQRNFQSIHTICSVTKTNRLSCINMTSIDLALNFIQFKIDQNAFINISLYDLRESYDDQKKETIFAIQFVQNLDQLQIGESLFKSYYVSIDISQHKMYFSPLNRFPGENYGVYVLRFFLGFGIFMVVATIGAMIWRILSDPAHQKRFSHGQEGIQLVAYDRAQSLQSQQL